jgi:hypothetical protein
VPALQGTAMEYKAIQFEIIQMTNPCCWKWVVFLDATRTRTGVALTRADAVLDAEFAIDKALEDRDRRSSSSSSRLSG